MTEPTVDQLRAFDRELRQRDPRFLRVVEADADAGQGIYELRVATTGDVGRAVFTFCEHGRVQTPRFDAETRLRLAAAATKAPDPYADGLTKLRAAAATDATRFEDGYKASRLRALEVETAKINAHIEANPFPRLTAAELADYRAPDPYRAGLDKLRSETERDRERLLAGQRVKR